MNKDVEKAFNEQINKELFSAYLYKAMSNYFQNCGLPGFANWMDVQVQEETFHANKMIKYVQDRRGCVELEAIAKPESSWSSIIQIFEQTLAHEEFVSKSIHELIDVAEKNSDKSSVTFLQWFVNEQIEEEATADSILSMLKIIGKDGSAIYHLDKEFAARTFTAPAE